MNCKMLEPKSRWKDAPAICLAVNLPAFESVKAAKAFLDTLPAISADRFFECPYCLGVHYESHERPPVGWSSGSSTREQTKRIPERIQERNRAFSARDSKRYASLISR